MVEAASRRFISLRVLNRFAGQRYRVTNAAGRRVYFGPGLQKAGAI